jgi:hypothetical protein
MVSSERDRRNEKLGAHDSAKEGLKDAVADHLQMEEGVSSINRRIEGDTHKERDVEGLTNGESVMGRSRVGAIPRLALGVPHLQQREALSALVPRRRYSGPLPERVEGATAPCRSRRPLPRSHPRPSCPPSSPWQRAQRLHPWVARCRGRCPRRACASPSCPSSFEI